MPKRRIVIADDLTGACDVSAQFVKQGLRACVSFGNRLSLRISPESVIVKDTETRYEQQRKAYRTVSKLAEECRGAGAELVYKKIDSTLRGNIGAELDAVLDIFDHQIALISPAYPEYHRTTINGNLLVGGRLLERTEYAKQSARALASSSVKRVISFQSIKAIDNIPLGTVRKGSKSIVNSIRGARRRGIRILCADAIHRTDLSNIAVACLQTKSLPCGSAGLAEEIALRLFPVQMRRVLVLSGSTSGSTMREIRRGQAATKCPVITANAAELGRNKISREREVSRIQRLAQKAFENSSYAIVSSVVSESDILQSSRLRDQHSRMAIVRGLAASVASLAHSGIISAIVLTGGETAAAFLKHVKVQEIRLEAEVLPGIALGTLVGGSAQGLRIATKAGGFGLPGSLTRLMRSLGRSPSRRV